MIDCPVPKNAEQLRSVLGMAKYYRKFVQNMSAIAGPLYALTHKDAVNTWTTKQQTAFDNIKSTLASDVVLAHYDSKKNWCGSRRFSVHNRSCSISQQTG